MTASVITVIAVVAGIAWLALMGISAIRNRGPEEVAPNLAPGLTNAEIETKRLETGQKAAIAFSAFLAISLPLYFLGEQARQDSFVEEFAAESVTRGAHLVEEFGCYNCHGPLGVGGVASFVEKRSGVTVSWTAPSINDVLYRYDEDEVNFWLTYGRGNTPMPAWGLAGGGPMNEAEIVDVVNYLKTIQIPQAEVLVEQDPAIKVQIDRLLGADATMESAILNQRQIIADIMSAPGEREALVPLADRADVIMESADEGIDTDDDGLSDVTETQLSALSAEAHALFAKVDAIELDPEVADAELATAAVTQLEGAIDNDPILTVNLDAIKAAIEEGAVDPAVGLTINALDEVNAQLAPAADLGVTGIPGVIDSLGSANSFLAALTDAAAVEGADAGVAEIQTAVQAVVDDGSDPDGDGLSTGAESTITSQMASASTATIPTQVTVVTLDPANPASVGGEPDLATATKVVGGLDSLRITLGVTADNQEKLLTSEGGGLEFLLNAQEQMKWQIDIEGVAAAMGTSIEDATRAVGLFNYNCARCHTAGFSAGIPFTQEIGSGGFGPALWDGRPLVQFGPAAALVKDDLLIQFLINGSEAQKPYGLNGFGSGRMPAFGALLSESDLELLAQFLRSGNLDGMGQP